MSSNPIDEQAGGRDYASNLTSLLAVLTESVLTLAPSSSGQHLRSSRHAGSPSKSLTTNIARGSCYHWLSFLASPSKEEIPHFEKFIYRGFSGIMKLVDTQAMRDWSSRMWYDVTCFVIVWQKIVLVFPWGDLVGSLEESMKHKIKTMQNCFVSVSRCHALPCISKYFATSQYRHNETALVL